MVSPQAAAAQVTHVVGDGNDAVKVYAGARVPGQRFDCYAVRFGRKRGVFRESVMSNAVAECSVRPRLPRFWAA